jgi:perosamine synthetase
LLAVGVKPGDEVITVSYTFIACANAIRQIGATPVFVDIERSSMTMDPDLLERAITPRTAAIMCVHQMGMPCDIARILPIARAHGIPVVEDAACALGSEVLLNGHWQPIGKPHGDIACFSLHPRKVITVGDGGVLTTNDPALDAKLRLLRQHGMSVPDTVRHGSPQVIFETYALPGYNYRLTDVQAAIGIEQLKRLPDIVRRRRECASRYASMLAAEVPDVEPPQEAPWAWTNWQSYCVRLPRGTDQRLVMQRMLDSGVATRRGIMCIHREKAYEGLQGPFPLPESEEAQDSGIILPLFPELTPPMQEKVVAALREAGRW